MIPKVFKKFLIGSPFLLCSSCTPSSTLNIVTPSQDRGVHPSVVKVVEAPCRDILPTKPNKSKPRSNYLLLFPNTIPSNQSVFLTINGTTPEVQPAKDKDGFQSKGSVPVSLGDGEPQFGDIKLFAEFNPGVNVSYSSNAICELTVGSGLTGLKIQKPNSLVQEMPRPIPRNH